MRFRLPTVSLRRQCSRTVFLCLLLFLLIYCVIFIVVILAYVKLNEIPSISHKIKNFLAGELVDFSIADNETGFLDPIVPNVVHYVKFRSTQLTFVEMVSMRAVLLNHRPDRIVVHCSNCVNLTLVGKYWDMLMDPEAWKAAPAPKDTPHGGGEVLPVEVAPPASGWPPIEVSHFREPTHIFGKKLSSVYHASDIARILILMQHGGIFLDSDTYVVQSLDRFRHFEFALGWPHNAFLGTQILIAHRNARFLKLWLNSYRWYLPYQWYYNAGQLPTEGILEKQPHLVHRVPDRFGVHYLVDQLYKMNWPGWRDYYSVHLLARHRDYLDKESPVRHFDEENVKTYNFTFGQMARKVLYGTVDIIH